MKWAVLTKRLVDKKGRLLGLADSNGKWSAQVFTDGVEFVQRGQAITRSLHAAQRACEACLKKNAAQRRAVYASRKARRGDSQ